MPLTRRQFAAAVASGWAASRLSASRALGQPLPSTREVPWLAEVQTPPPQPPVGAPQLAPLLADVQGNPLKTVADWKKKKEELQQAWLALLGMWDPPRRPLEYTIVDSARTPKITRQLIRYETERGSPVEAYLLIPTRGPSSKPGVVVFHSTVDYTIRQGAGLEGPPEAAWGAKLAERGFIVLCPRCFLWDDVEPVDYQRPLRQHKLRHPRSLGMGKMLYDAMRAVDILTTVEGVNPKRIGAAGHSLGAKEVLYLAALDERVRAAVSSEGGVGTTFSNWEAPWYLGSKQFGREHHELLALAAPRPFLLIGGESADGARSWPLVAAALEVYRLYGAPARIGLLNHGQGHTIPPLAEHRTYEWLQTYV